MNFQPEYRTFLTRVWLQVNKTILLFSIIVILVSILEQVNILNVLLFGLFPVVCILILRAFMVHRYHLKHIKINEEVKNIEITIFKYDSLHKVHMVPYQDVSIRISQALFSLRPYYHIKIYQKGKLILKQNECNAWKVSDMQNINIEIKRLKQNLRSLENNI